MFNMIKMDLYRMFKSRSFYVIGIIIAALLLFVTYIEKTDPLDSVSTSKQNMEEISDEDIIIGISVNPEYDEEGRISVLSDFTANCSGMVPALFFVIFTVIFATADHTTGYDKNIAGQVKDRAYIIISKAVSLFVFTVIMSLWYMLMIALSHLVMFGDVSPGDIKDLVSYTAVQIVLNYALVIIVMTFSIIFRNNLISMIVAICLCMHMFSLLYNGIDLLLKKAGASDFSIVSYTVTGKISTLAAGAPVRDNIEALVVAAAFVIFGGILSSVVFRKRDVI